MKGINTVGASSDIGEKYEVDVKEKVVVVDNNDRRPPPFQAFGICLAPIHAGWPF